jgi:uncharacterized membrane protein
MEKNLIIDEKIKFLLNYYNACCNVHVSHSSRIVVIHGWSLTVLIAYISFAASQKYLLSFSAVIIGIVLIIVFNIIECLERRYVHIYSEQLYKIEQIFSLQVNNIEDFHKSINDFSFKIKERSKREKIIEIFQKCIKPRQIIWSGILLLILFTFYILFPFMNIN